jgi:Mg2+/Co2+ transporter CorB
MFLILFIISSDRLNIVLDAMMNGNTSIAVCVTEFGNCIGIINIKDIVSYYVTTDRR